MKRLFLLLLVLCFTSSIFGNTPETLSAQNEKILVYRVSGQYLKDITQVANDAARYLIVAYHKNELNPSPKKLAIVLDIDETSLSNYKNFRFEDGHVVVDRKHMEPAIPPVRNLYRIALQHHVAVFFVTGRRETERDFTEKNLRQAGYYKWKKLYMRPVDDTADSMFNYKNNARQKIADAGYDIVLTMGDQEVDLEGTNTGQRYKLPNPFYTLH